MTNPYQNTAIARLIADRIRDLAHKKTQAEIASESDFPNAKMMIVLENEPSKVSPDSVRSPYDFSPLSTKPAAGQTVRAAGENAEMKSP